MATAGRKLGTRHQDEIRTKIQTTQIINRLQSAFEGNVELSAIQVNIAKTLLDKSLPNLQATEITGAGEDGEVLTGLTVKFVKSE